MNVKFPDGTIVSACSLAERREANPNRDFGLYMDRAWNPTWKAELSSGRTSDFRLIPVLLPLRS